jgi:O-antigen ligase
MSYFKLSRFFLYLIPLTVVVVTTSTLFPFIVGKYVLFRSFSAIAFICFLLGLIFDRKADIYLERFKKIIRHPLFISVFIFAFIFVLAGFFGIDPSFSFWSNFERGEGGLQMIHFFVFFLTMLATFKDKKHWQNMFTSFIVSAGLMIFYGILAGVGATGFIGPKFDGNFTRFQGSIGNPAYVAVYLIFAMFFTLYKLISKYKEISDFKKISLVIITAIFFAFFVLAATRGAFLGIIAGVFFSFLYLGFSKKSWRKYVFSLLLLLIVLFSSGVYFKDANFVKSLPASRIFDISLKAKTFEDRAIMWGIAWEGFLEKPILGMGPETYLETFQKKYNPEYFKPESGAYGAWFDRAHSVVFDYLYSTGILGFLSYLSMFGVFFWYLFKKLRKSNISPVLISLLIGLPIAYLVQGLVLFDISTTYISLFVFLAFAVYKFQNLQQMTNNKQPNNS